MVLAIVACAFVGYGAYLALSGVVRRPNIPESGSELPGAVESLRGRIGSMHKLEVVLQADCVGGVSEALRKAKIGPFGASDITIFDPAAAPQGSYRGAPYAIGRERVKLELVVPDHEVEPAVEAIRDGIDAFGEGYAELVVLAVQDSMDLRPSPWTRRRGAR